MSEEPYNSIKDTEDHISLVRENLHKITAELLERCLVHDKSKMESPEKEVFDEVTPKLKALTYGSPEYAASLKDMDVALDHHYANNSHHPEHYLSGMRGFDLVDLVEMFCDWCAATERHANGDIHASIKHNKDRFEYDDVLASIFTNTAERLKMGKGG